MPARSANTKPKSLAEQGLLAVMRMIDTEGEARGAAQVRRFFEGVSGNKRDEAIKDAEQMAWIERKRDGHADLFEVTQAGQEHADAMEGSA